MYKQLKQHERYIKSCLRSFSSLNVGEREHLRAYHQSRVHDFQHERLIHLLVTFFFGWLILFATASFFAIVSNFNIPLLSLASLILIIILLITEVFYVIYYFRLENGVQRLYPLTKRLNQSPDHHNK